MFYTKTSFNRNLSNWDISKVANMEYMFYGETKVTDMGNMFYNATSFNSNLSNWDVSNFRDMRGMFTGVLSMNNINLRLYFKVLNSQ